MNPKPFDRRTFLRAAAVASVATVAGCGGDGDGNGNDETPTATATEADDGGGGVGDVLDEEPDYGGYLENANSYGGTEDHRGADAVTVMVGADNGFAFEPAAIAISAGTEVTWEWTGEGDQHNVISDDLGFESELTQEMGFTFSQTIEQTGTHTYYCGPHEFQGMKGGIHVE